MKILFVSVFGYHFFNWVLQLKNSGHDVYWFDVNDANTYVKQIDFVHQTVKWKNRWDYPGRQRIKKNFPSLNKFINKFNQREFRDVFQQKIHTIQPDVVHSFEMYSSCVPILEIMKTHPNIKWIYTTWGTDLFFFQNEPEKLDGIQRVFTRLDYMFADCKRDFLLAQRLGFHGEYLGTFPGGGGYDLRQLNSLVTEYKDRKLILIKGYQGRFGRCLKVLEALKEIESTVKDFEIIVFGASEEVLKFKNSAEYDKMHNLQIMGLIGRGEVLKLMGQSAIYVGNSLSDGMPNTLLEAIILEAFPIQSNPGGATAEIIEHGKNGLLIENPESVREIAFLMKRAIQDYDFRKSAIQYNSNFLKPSLKREVVSEKVLNSYDVVQQNVKILHN